MDCLRVLLGTLETSKHPKTIRSQSRSESGDSDLESHDPESLSWSEEVVENPGLYLGAYNL